MQQQTNSYYEDQTVDFDEDTARDHAHKLEAADKAAASFMDKTFPVLAVTQSAAGVGDSSAQIQSLTRQLSDLTALVGKMAEAVHGAVAPSA
jgi:hypothetical protein